MTPTHTEGLPLWVADAPSRRGAEPTSAEAGHRVRHKAASLRERVLSLMRSKSRYWGGWTADEVAEILGESVLATRPRLSELRKAGFIRATGERRVNASGLRAAVWVAT